MPHQKYSSHIEKLLLPDEEIINTYEQSDAYVYENPLSYGSNVILIFSFILEVIVTMLVAPFPFPDKTDSQGKAIASTIWTIFFVFDLVIYMLTFLPIGNWLRRLRFGNFEYDYIHASKEQKNSYENGIIYMRSFYTPFIFASILACSFALHIYQGWPDSSRSMFLTALLVVGLSFIPFMMITMVLRRINRKLIILTNQRVIVYNKRTHVGDSIAIGKWVYMDELSNYYTITLHDKKVLSKYYLGEALFEYIAMRRRHEHTFLAIRGVKNFEDLYDKLAERTTPASEEINQLDEQ